MSDKYPNKMYRVEYTIGGWGNGFKPVKSSLLPLDGENDNLRKAEAKSKLARSHGSTIDVIGIFEVIS